MVREKQSVIAAAVRSGVRPDIDLDRLDELEIDEIGWRKFVFLQFNEVWQALVLITVYVTYVTCVYEITFVRHMDPGVELLYFVLIDIIYFIDLMMAVAHRKWHDVRKRKMYERKHMFAIIVDAVSLLPLSLMYYIITQGNIKYKTYRNSMINRLLRVYRSYYYFKKHTLGKHSGLMIITEFFVLFSLLGHTLAGLTFLTKDDTDPKNWAYHIHSKHLDLNGTTTWYFVCLYYVMQVISHDGLGDLVGVYYIRDILFTVIFSMAGLLIFLCLFMGSVCSSMLLARKRYFQYVYRLSAQRHYLEAAQIREKTIRRVLYFYDIFWIMKNGIKEAKLESLLPLAMRMEVCTDIFWDAFYHSHFFKNIDKSVLRALALCMKAELLLPGDILFAKGVQKNRMVYIVSGIVQILSDEDDESPIVSFSGGTVLGESCLVVSYSSRSNVKCVTLCETFVLDKQSYYSTMSLFPEERDTIHSYVLEQYANARYLHGLLEKKEASSEHEGEVKVIKWLKNNLKQYMRKGKKKGSTVGKQSVRSKKPTPHYTFMNLDMYVIAKEVHLTSDSVCLTTSFPFVLKPDSSLLMLWNVLMTVLALLVSTVYPYYIAFDNNFPLIVDVGFKVIDIFYMLDLLINIVTAVKIKDDLITNYWEIFQERLSDAGFLADIFATIPLEVTLDVFTDVGESVTALLKLNRLVKVWKVHMFFSYLDKHMIIDIAYLEYFKYLLYYTIAIYWMGCVMYMQTCFNNECDPNGWYGVLRALEVKTLVGECHKHTFLVSMYFTIQQVVLSGIGDIHPMTLSDIIGVILLVTTGYLMFSFYTANVVATEILQNEQETLYKQYLSNMRIFMKEKNFSKRMQDRVNLYLTTQWAYDKAALILGEKHLLWDLPLNIKDEVTYQSVATFLAQTPLFRNCTSDFLQSVANGARRFVLPPQGTIAEEGKVTDDIYIVRRGYCKVVYDEILGKDRYRSCGRGTSIGAVEALLGLPQFHSAKTQTDCDFIVVSAKQLREISETRGLEFAATLKDMRSWEELKAMRGRLDFHIGTIFEGSVLVEEEAFVIHLKDPRYKDAFARLGIFRFLQWLLLPVVFTPKGKFTICWEASRALFAFLSMLVFPVMHAVQLEFPEIMYFGTFLDVTAFIDLYVRLHVSHYDERGLLITHPLNTAAYYLKHSFITDFVACVPLDYFLPQWVGLYKCLNPAKSRVRLLRIVQGHRLVRFMDLCVSSHSDNAALIITKYLAYLLLLISFLASVMVIHTCQICKLPPTDTKYSALEARSVVYPTFPIPKPTRPLYKGNLYIDTDNNTWLGRSPYAGRVSPAELQILAFHWMVSLMIGVGIGDISAQNYNELWFSILISLLGFFIKAYIFAKITNIKKISDTELNKYQAKMKHVLSFMNVENVEERKQRRVVHTLELLWKQSGSHLASKYPAKIFRNYHPSLKRSLTSHMYGEFLSKVPLFAKQPTSFYEEIGHIAKEMSFLRHTYLLQVNDVVDDIYIVRKGEVTIHNADDIEVAFLARGDIFGNITDAPLVRSTIGAIAQKNGVLIIVSSENFYRILKRYPQLHHRFNVAVTNNVGYIETAEEGDWVSISTMESSKGRSSSIGSSVDTEGTTRPSVTFDPYEGLQTTRNVFLLVVTPLVSVSIVMYKWALEPTSIPLLLTCYGLDAMYIIKMIFDFITAFESDEGILVTDLKRIAGRYFKSPYGFVLDFASTFPIEHFALAYKPSKRPPIVSWLQLNRCLRIMVIFHYLKSVSKRLHGKIVLVRLLYASFMVTLTFQIAASIWIGITCLGGKCKSIQEGLFTPMAFYMRAIYLVCSLITHTGFGAMVPENNYEILLTDAIIFWGLIGQPIVMGEFSALIQRRDRIKAEFYHKANELMDHYKGRNLSKSLVRKVSDYIYDMWNASRGSQIPELFLEGPQTLLNELKHETYGCHLLDTLVFSVAHGDCLRQIARQFVATNYYPGNYIVFEGDITEMIYFIHSGEVNVVIQENKLVEIIKDTLRENDMFGLEQGLRLRKRFCFTYRARTHCVILSLHRYSWLHLLYFFPSARSKIYQNLEEQINIGAPQNMPI